MKKISAVVLMGTIFLLLNSKAFSLDVSVIKPYPLTITYYKTTNLVFPYAIKSVDRGSRDILVQKAKGVKNILQLKAAITHFQETNLTVITADGKLYSFTISYAKKPAILNLQFNKSTATQPIAIFSNSADNEHEMEKTATKVLTKKKSIHGIKDHKYRMKLQLQGLYVKGDLMYYRFSIQNRSNINYKIGQLRFAIKDKKVPKRTASQELQIKPLFIKGDVNNIAAKSRQAWVIALPKFTIPDKKYLDVQLREEHGGRNLELKIHNRTIVRAEMIN